MAQKKRRQSARQASLNRRYGSVIGGITKLLKRLKSEGLEIIGDIYPTRPKVITEASIRQARRFAVNLPERAFYIDTKTGEAFGIHDLIPHTAVNSKITEARKLQGIPLTNKFINSLWKEELTHNKRVNAEIEKAERQRNIREERTRSPAQLANDQRLRNKWKIYREQKKADIENYFASGVLKERSRRDIEKEAKRRGFYIDENDKLQKLNKSREKREETIQEIDDEIERMKQEEEEDRGNYGEDTTDYDGEFWSDQNEDEDEDLEEEDIFDTSYDEDTHDPELDYWSEKDREEMTKEERANYWKNRLENLMKETHKQWEDEWKRKQSTRPVSETDTVLGNIEDILDKFAPKDNWSKDLTDKHMQDYENISNILDDAIRKNGRDKVAKTLQDAGYEIATMIEDALYASGKTRYAFADARGRVAFSIVQFKNLLGTPTTDEVKTASESMEEQEYYDSTDDNYDDDYGFEESDDERTWRY